MQLLQINLPAGQYEVKYTGLQLEQQEEPNASVMNRICITQVDKHQKIQHILTSSTSFWANSKLISIFPPLMTVMWVLTCMNNLHTDGQKLQDKQKQTVVYLEWGHKEAAWPRHFKPPRAINYKVSGCKGSLMCIESYCTKNNHWLFCLLEFLSKKQWSDLCLLSWQMHSVCEIYTNKHYCWEVNLAGFPSFCWGGCYNRVIYEWMNGFVKSPQQGYAVKYGCE